jgi:hypothetical protein
MFLQHHAKQSQNNIGTFSTSTLWTTHITIEDRLQIDFFQMKIQQKMFHLKMQFYLDNKVFWIWICIWIWNVCTM